MSEEKKVVAPQEINDDDLEQVAGGYTPVELTESRKLAITSSSCPIASLNAVFGKK